MVDLCITKRKLGWETTIAPILAHRVLDRRLQRPGDCGAFDLRHLSKHGIGSQSLTIPFGRPVECRSKEHRIGYALSDPENMQRGAVQHRSMTAKLSDENRVVGRCRGKLFASGIS
jgi:hypothetical protein